MTTPVRVAIVGGGWRGQLFARLSAMLADDVELVGACVRRPETADQVSSAWKVPAYTSVTELVDRQHPGLVIACVPWAASPSIVEALVAAGTRVLAETPPAPDADGLRALWDRIGAARAVQVAEQYLLMPGHAARRELLRRGVIGDATSVQVSSTHGYHAVSLIRGMLGVGCGPTTVTAHRTTAPLVDPLTRDGWTDDDDPKPAATTVAALDFGDGRSGVYDFTDNQWHNRLRARRIVIRGSRGEIVDDTVVHLAGRRLIVRSPLVRSQLGYDLNLDGYDTEHIAFEGGVLYANPFLGHRLMDEEIAMSAILVRSAAWAADRGAGPYELAEACQDHLIGLAIDESADTRRPVATGIEAWASAANA